MAIIDWLTYKKCILCKLIKIGALAQKKGEAETVSVLI